MKLYTVRLLASLLQCLSLYYLFLIRNTPSSTAGIVKCESSILPIYLAVVPGCGAQQGCINPCIIATTVCQGAFAVEITVTMRSSDARADLQMTFQRRSQRP
ncbi:hypothetical protein F4779DRAFT_555155 [Xylariaceae sp. FL0662B]|nr:hypothetical protein F4779DRAFT_555155 [Xylariaceae sp. FL0662B]